MPGLFSKSVLKPENSIIAGLATAGAVFAVFELNVGPVSVAHATEANDGNLNAALKKAGYTALVLVAGVGLIARDANIIILGGGTIIAMELGYRHAIMAHKETGQIVMPSAKPTTAKYSPAENVVPLNAQGQSVAVG